MRMVLISFKSVSIEEIEQAVRHANPHKAPGLDGFNAYIL